jgi:hypothetical protein
VLPPFVGVAVKVTEVPAQTVFVEAAIIKSAGRIGFTVMVIALDVAGEPETHASLEVMVHLT